MNNPAVRKIKKRGRVRICKICDHRRSERKGINIIVDNITQLICLRCLVKIRGADLRQQQLGRLK